MVGFKYTTAITPFSKRTADDKPWVAKAYMYSDSEGLLVKDDGAVPDYNVPVGEVPTTFVFDKVEEISGLKVSKVLAAFIDHEDDKVVFHFYTNRFSGEQDDNGQFVLKNGCEFIPEHDAKLILPERILSQMKRDGVIEG